MLTLPEKIFEKEADESPLNKQTKKKTITALLC